jgi:tetratricopeptide (TPR) repeat protein
LFACAIIALAVGAAYWRSFSVPFFFDDEPAITANQTIRHLWPPGAALSPPLNATGATGRPMVNLSLAINWAIGGANPWGYHAFNFGLHLLAGFALFGIVRRTLRLPIFAGRWSGEATWLGLAIALLWTLHPLQTETVTCVIQRSELLVSLCYLLTLYGFLRSVGSPQPGRWQFLAFVACLLGMASKEVMVTAPLVILLFDRTFVVSNFREAFRQRGLFHLSLASTWALLAVLVVGTGGNRGGVTGGFLDASSWSYALTQCRAVAIYLKLSVWPNPLVMDYGTDLVARANDVLPQAAMLLALVTFSAIALWRRSPFGFLGAWFFAILAPSSTLVVLRTQTIAEHRMYLPLAAAVTLAVLGLRRMLGRPGLAVALALAVGAGWLSAQRNRDYRTEEAIWTDTIAKRPENARAHNNLGTVFYEQGRLAEARNEFEEALRLQPEYPDAQQNLGLALLHAGRAREAVNHFLEAVRLNPLAADWHYDLGNAFFQLNRKPEALAEFERATQLKPDDVAAQYNLGTMLVEAGRAAEAKPRLEAALRLQPDYPEAHFSLGNALFQLHQEAAAREHYATALRLRPDYAAVPFNLGTIFLDTGRLTEAVAQFERAIEIQPDYPEARCNLALALLRLQRPAEAVAQLEQALRLRPDYPQARNALAVAQATLRSAPAPK